MDRFLSQTKFLFQIDLSSFIIGLSLSPVLKYIGVNCKSRNDDVADVIQFDVLETLDMFQDFYHPLA